MVKLAGTVALRRSRVRRLQASLQDERSGRVVFVSHCLLNENTRYSGGAFRSGAVDEVVDTYRRDGTGICQLPCPEQLAGGCAEATLLFPYGRPWLSPAVRLFPPVLSAYPAARYRPLARRVAREITDYQRSGFDVVGVVGVDASPTCGVTTTLDLDASPAAAVGCPLHRFDRRFMNDTVLNGSARPGRGLFIDALSDALARRGGRVPLLGHNLRSETPDPPFTAGPKPAGAVGARRTPGRPRAIVAAAHKVLNAGSARARHPRSLAPPSDATAISPRGSRRD